MDDSYVSEGDCEAAFDAGAAAADGCIKSFLDKKKPTLSEGEMALACAGFVAQLGQVPYQKHGPDGFDQFAMQVIRAIASLDPDNDLLH